MENFITKLSDEEIGLLGKEIVKNKSLELIKLTRERNGFCTAEYKTTKRYSTPLNIYDKTKVFKLNLDISDFEVNGLINTLITMEKQKTLDRFVSFMVAKFGREYATKCFYYHKEAMDIYYKNNAEFIKKEFAEYPAKLEKELNDLQKSIKINLNHLKYVLNIALINKNEKELSL